MDPALSSQYHAHADGELLVLLDVTPSQEMLDEGVAREVINKIQKLRKKVKRIFIWYYSDPSLPPSLSSLPLLPPSLPPFPLRLVSNLVML